MQAIVQGLEQVKGDLSEDQAAFRKALTNLDPTFPEGKVTLDDNRNAIQPAYVVQVVDDNGELGFKVIKTIENVDQGFGGAFKAGSPAPSRTEPQCAKGPVPPWASN